MALLADENIRRAMYEDLEDDAGFEDEDGDEDIVELPAGYFPGINICIICRERPPYSKGRNNYMTCGMTCARVLEQLKSRSNSLPARPLPQPQNRRQDQRPRLDHSLPANVAGVGRTQISDRDSSRGRYIQNTGNQFLAQVPRVARKPALPCVVCLIGFCRDDKRVTCSMACAEKLCKTGSENPNMCNYCHRRPKVTGHDQCGMTCGKLAKSACLMCKSRPKFKRYHLCGRVCKAIATKTTPLILEAPTGHTTFEFVKKKFETSWKSPATAIPTIKKVFKIIEGQNFLQPYDRYKNSVGNEVFRYHGTSRQCTLGTGGNTQLCASSTCRLCCILRTSFKTSLANPNGSFGPGVYSSSAPNLSYAFTAGGAGAIILTKVVLGKVQIFTAGNVVKACPPGFNSVVYDQNGPSNETIVYSDDAIRPVFLITF
ncbi:hypothetical protein BDN70DRAFT_881159 [Pholiota conissans]|uniref:PARP catalytic domain-containing protein n=1 Tax=Pholiota conissans TaxID=109636 RepID=A0A9P6CYG2_9AGAR|nr:hypothetical protein BDN70DRAFT_881159 [Pholiota conissans]